MQERVNYTVKRNCKSCNAIFSSCAIDNETYCVNCREDEDDLFAFSSREYTDIVNTACNTNVLGAGSCRTNPVFYD